MTYTLFFSFLHCAVPLIFASTGVLAEHLRGPAAAIPRALQEDVETKNEEGGGQGKNEPEGEEKMTKEERE